MFLITDKRNVEVFYEIGLMNCNSRFSVKTSSDIHKFLVFGEGQRFLTIDESGLIEAYTSEPIISNRKVGQHKMNLKEDEEVTAVDICPEDVNIVVAISKKIPNRLEKIEILSPQEGGKYF